MQIINTTIKKLLSVVPLFFMLYLIFFFSGQNGETSGGLSEKLTLWLITAFDKVFRQGFSHEQIMELADFWEFYVRKAAHVTEYVLLTFSVFLALTELSMSYRKNLATEASIFALAKINKKSKYHMESTPVLTIWERLILMVPATVLLAALDELHQYYVPGRYGVVTDVLIDSIGIAIATLFILLVYMIQSLLRAKSIHSSNVRG